MTFNSTCRAIIRSGRDLSDDQIVYIDQLALVDEGRGIRNLDCHPGRWTAAQHYSDDREMRT
jgi:hypothetical protein